MELQELRNEINRIDDEMLALLGQRLAALLMTLGREEQERLLKGEQH